MPASRFWLSWGRWVDWSKTILTSSESREMQRRLSQPQCDGPERTRPSPSQCVQPWHLILSEVAASCRSGTYFPLSPLAATVFGRLRPLLEEISDIERNAAR